MMNKYLVIYLLTLLTLPQIGCVSAQPAQQLKVTVSDDQGAPIENAEVTVQFRAYKGDPEIKTGLSNEDGIVQITGASPLSPNLIVSKEGYYESRLDKVSVVTPETAKSLLASKSFEVTLREKRNPRPLFAKRLGNVKIPIKDEWNGYDLKLGDWVEPHGKGERADILFRYGNEFLGYRLSNKKLEKLERMKADEQDWTEEKQKHHYGNWSGRLEIVFPGEKEGILTVIESAGYVGESEMRMPHLSREESYEPSKSWEGWMPSKIIDPNIGYFLRVRVRERNDQILEANYAKINEEIRFDPRGMITLSYYFNPDVNDRNLEFDTKQNLLKGLEWSERVKLP